MNRIVAPVLSFLTLIVIIACGSNPDRDVLIALYQATDGPNWKDSTNWLSDTSIGEWYGATTDADGRVIRLELSDNRLNGEIPPALGGLSELEWLYLWGNQLRGSVPSELSNLSNLTNLALGDNRLSGEIPPELDSLTKLTALGLLGNQLERSDTIRDWESNEFDRAAPSREPAERSDTTQTRQSNESDGP